MTTPKGQKLEHQRGKPLSPHEARVLQLVADGRSGAEIAAGLETTESGIQSSIRRILAKLGARNREQAVAIGYDEAIIGARRSKPKPVPKAKPGPKPKASPGPPPIPAGLLNDIAGVLRTVTKACPGTELSRRAARALHDLRAYTDKPSSIPPQRTRDSRP